MKTSSAGRALIEQREGKRLSAYRDSVGVLTIGVGHTGRMSPPPVTAGMRITEAQCDAMLADDLGPVEAAIAKALKVPVSQHEFDAMASLGFNIGAAGLARSTVIKRLNNGDVAGAANAFLMWSKPAELIERRRAERLEFLQPDKAMTVARAGALQHAATVAKARAGTAQTRAVTVAATGAAGAATIAASHHGTASLAIGLLALAAAIADGLLARCRNGKAAALAFSAAAHLDAAER